jgi:hypothetical protein
VYLCTIATYQMRSWNEWLLSRRKKELKQIRGQHFRRMVKSVGASTVKTVEKKGVDLPAPRAETYVAMGEDYHAFPIDYCYAMTSIGLGKRR